eukprot:scaffold8790_cov187-Amphora_coffeaeformis.AAC.9
MERTIAICVDPVENRRLCAGLPVPHSLLANASYPARFVPVWSSTGSWKVALNNEWPNFHPNAVANKWEDSFARAIARRPTMLDSRQHNE